MRRGTGRDRSAAAGTVAGPLGTLAGAAAGAILGGLAGKAAAEAIDPTVEDAYWKQNYAGEPYYESSFSYDDYAPAYRTGYNGRTQFAGRKFDDVERDLESSYNRAKGSSKLSWEKAKYATRAAWDRIDRNAARNSARS